MSRMTFLVAIFSSAVSAGTLLGQENLTLPSGPPPQLLTIHSVNKDKAEINLTAVTTRFIWETKQREVQRDGENTLATKPVRKTIYETRGASIAVASAKFFDIDANELSGAGIWKRAIPGTIVAVAADSKMVDPAYRKAFSKTTLLVLSEEFAVNNVLQIAPHRGAEPIAQNGAAYRY